MRVSTVDHPDERAMRCLGRLCGLVNGLEYRTGDRDAGEFSIPTLSTTDVGQTITGDDGRPIDVTVGGGGRTTAEATLTALCEFLERYSMYWPLDDSVDCSYAELTTRDCRVVDLDYLRVWRDEDLADAGFDEFDADVPIEWANGTDLHTGEDIFVPAELVAFPLHDDHGRFPSTTSGNACGSSLVGALVRSLYEQIERDAVMRAWYTQQRPTRLDISAFDELAAFRDRIEPAQCDLDVLELPSPTDCVVTATTLVNDRDRRPKFLLFAGAHLTMEGAISDVLHETAEGFLQTKYRLVARQEDDSVVKSEEIYNFEGNVQYYLQPENYDTVAHLREGDVRSVQPGEHSAPEGPTAELRRVLAASTTETNATPIAVELTPPDVRELGMYTTGVYVPELIDMSLPGVPPVKHPTLDRIETTKPHPFP